MCTHIEHSADLTLPGPGIYRVGDSGSHISICLIDIVDMLREFFPAVNPDGYRSSKGRVFAGGALHGDFLSDDELSQVNGFKALKKQVEWIGGRYALKMLVSETLPEAGHAREIAVDYEHRGAPYLVNHPDISISISHAGEYALAGISMDLGKRIGLDLERIGRQGLHHVMKVAFTDREVAVSGGSPEAACWIWTRKEAYLKFVKTGFRESLKRVDVSGSPIVHGGVPVSDLKIETFRVGEDYLLSVVYD
jgi:4'-phosphopantetheinyl transferase